MLVEAFENRNMCQRQHLCYVFSDIKISDHRVSEAAALTWLVKTVGFNPTMLFAEEEEEI